jgi:nitrate reductase gamma subunit
MRFRDNEYSVTAKSSQLLNAPGDRTMFIIAMMSFHIAIIIIILGHLGGFLTPREMFLWAGITDEMHAEIAHLIGGTAAVVCFLAMLYLIKRRFFNKRISATSSFGDKAVLLVIFVQLILGFITIFYKSAVQPAEKVVLLGHYFQGIVMLNFSAYEFVLDMPIITLLHIFLGWTIILLIPFTRLIHVVHNYIRVHA